MFYILEQPVFKSSNYCTQSQTISRINHLLVLFTFSFFYIFFSSQLPFLLECTVLFLFYFIYKTPTKLEFTCTYCLIVELCLLSLTKALFFKYAVKLMKLITSRCNFHVWLVIFLFVVPCWEALGTALKCSSCDCNSRTLEAPHGRTDSLCSFLLSHLIHVLNVFTGVHYDALNCLARIKTAWRRVEWDCFFLFFFPTFLFWNQVITSEGKISIYSFFQLHWGEKSPPKNVIASSNQMFITPLPKSWQLTDY